MSAAFFRWRAVPRPVRSVCSAMRAAAAGSPELLQRPHQRIAADVVRGRPEEHRRRQFVGALPLRRLEPCPGRPLQVARAGRAVGEDLPGELLHLVRPAEHLQGLGGDRRLPGVGPEPFPDRAGARQDRLLRGGAEAERDPGRGRQFVVAVGQDVGEQRLRLGRRAHPAQRIERAEPLGHREDPARRQGAQPVGGPRPVRQRGQRGERLAQVRPLQGVADAVLEPLQDLRPLLLAHRDTLGDQQAGQVHGVPAVAGPAQQVIDDQVGVAVRPLRPQAEGEQRQGVLGLAHAFRRPAVQLGEIGRNLLGVGPGGQELGERVVQEAQVVALRDEQADAEQQVPEFRLPAPGQRQSGRSVVVDPPAGRRRQRPVALDPVPGQRLDQLLTDLADPAGELVVPSLPARAATHQVVVEQLVETQPVGRQRSVGIDSGADRRDGRQQRVLHQLAQPAVLGLLEEARRRGLRLLRAVALGAEPLGGEVAQLRPAERFHPVRAERGAAQRGEFDLRQRAAGHQEAVRPVGPGVLGDHPDELGPGLPVGDLVEPVHHHQPLGALDPAGEQPGIGLGHQAVPHAVPGRVAQCGAPRPGVLDQGAGGDPQRHQRLGGRRGQAALLPEPDLGQQPGDVVGQGGLAGAGLARDEEMPGPFEDLAQRQHGVPVRRGGVRVRALRAGRGRAVHVGTAALAGRRQRRPHLLPHVDRGQRRLLDVEHVVREAVGRTGLRLQQVAQRECGQREFGPGRQTRTGGLLIGGGGAVPGVLRAGPDRDDLGRIPAERRGEGLGEFEREQAGGVVDAVHRRLSGEAGPDEGVRGAVAGAHQRLPEPGGQLQQLRKVLLLVLGRTARRHVLPTRSSAPDFPEFP
ncbi:hypothetical protein [Kitasatospora griseola]